MKVAGELVVGCCDAAEILEPAEHALDQVALAVGDDIVRDDLFACRVARDDGLGSRFGDRLPQPVCVMGFVAKQAGERTGGLDQGRSERDIAGIARGEQPDPRPPMPSAEMGVDERFAGSVTASRQFWAPRPQRGVGQGRHSMP